MDGRIEFCCGMAPHPDAENGGVYITFGFQDNSAYMIHVGKDHLNQLLDK